MNIAVILFWQNLFVAAVFSFFGSSVFVVNLGCAFLLWYFDVQLWEVGENE